MASWISEVNGTKAEITRLPGFIIIGKASVRVEPTPENGLVLTWQTSARATAVDRVGPTDQVFDEPELGLRIIKQ
jgi:hypothetical protein